MCKVLFSVWAALTLHHDKHTSVNDPVTKAHADHTTTCLLCTVSLTVHKHDSSVTLHIAGMLIGCQLEWDCVMLVSSARSGVF